MSLLPELVYRFNTIHIKIPAIFFVAIHKIVLKFICKGTGSIIANAVLTRIQYKEISLPNFKNYCITILVKTMGMVE